MALMCTRTCVEGWLRILFFWSLTYFLNTENNQVNSVIMPFLVIKTPETEKMTDALKLFWTNN